jgi:hypothetical protein
VPSADILAVLISRIARDAEHELLESAALCNSQQQGGQRGGTELCTILTLVVQPGNTRQSECEERVGRVDWRGCDTAFTSSHSHSEAGALHAIPERCARVADVCECFQRPACGIQA